MGTLGRLDTKTCCDTAVAPQASIAAARLFVLPFRPTKAPVPGAVAATGSAQHGEAAPTGAAMRAGPFSLGRATTRPASGQRPVQSRARRPQATPTIDGTTRGTPTSSAVTARQAITTPTTCASAAPITGTTRK